jgi:hypothetical protein
MKLLNFNIQKKHRLLWFLVILAAFWSCNKNEEIEFELQSKEVIFTRAGDSLYLLGGVDVNQLDLLEVTLLAKDIRNNSKPTEVKVSSIPNDDTGPLPEIQLDGVNNEGKFISSLPALGIETQNHNATLKFTSKFNDGEEIIRTFQVRPVSPFQYTAPASVFAIIDNISKISYTVDSGDASVDEIKVRKKVNDSAVSEVAGEWGVTGEITVQGQDYNVGDSVYYQIEASNENATATSDWIGIAVLKPEGEYTYLFEIFFGGTPAIGFTDGCWAGVQGGKSFVNTVFDYEGASGGTGTFDQNGWNTLYTHIVGNTPIVAYSGLMTANYSSNAAAVGNDKDLLTPEFDISNTGNNKLVFYYLCKASGDKVNHLKVFSTTDNENWTEIVDLAEQDTWGKQEFDLAPDVIRIKFTGISGGADNVGFNSYIDDIKIQGEF